METAPRIAEEARQLTVAVRFKQTLQKHDRGLIAAARPGHAELYFALFRTPIGEILASRLPEHPEDCRLDSGKELVG